MTSIRAFLRLLSGTPRWQVGALLALMLLAGLTEGIGLVLLVPLLEVLGGGASKHGLIQGLLRGLAVIGIPSTPGGLLIAFIGLVAFRTGVQYLRERLGLSVREQEERHP